MKRKRVDDRIRYFRKKYSLRPDEAYEPFGYSFNQWKEHIESLWKPGMTWDNYGKEWVIDHITQISLFSESTPLSVVNSLVNLQPLWHHEHNLKNSHENRARRVRKKARLYVGIASSHSYH